MASTWIDGPTAAELAAIEAPLSGAAAAVVEAYWDGVIGECEAAVEAAPRPTSWLGMDTAEQRQVRRETRRLAAAAVRALPVLDASVSKSVAA